MNIKELSMMCADAVRESEREGKTHEEAVDDAAMLLKFLIMNATN